jgi:hypothetical protein
MIRRIVGEIPVWMRADHPVLRHLLSQRHVDSRSAKMTRAFFYIMLAGIFLLVGYANASNLFESNPFDLPFSQLLIELLFWPVFILQVGLQLAVLLTTMSTIDGYKRRQTWDSLRTTTEGMALTMRTRWSAIVFYRMRGPLSLLTLVRVVLIGGLLFDLTAFQGEYLRNLTGRIEPNVGVELSVLLLAFLMTATLLLPMTAIGFDAAVGLLISTFVSQRTYIILTQLVLTVVRIAIIGVLVLAVEEYRTDTIDTSELILWLLLFIFGVIGDWGISFLYLGFYGAKVWIEVPYGIMIGPAMMLFVLAQAVLTDFILAYAIRRAERRE